MFRIAHISDLHCGSPHFVPNLMERAINEVNELEADMVICTGDLTNFGFRQEYAEARAYLDRINCETLVVIPGNHDSRNVGYVHFEELFGDRSSVVHKGGVSVVAVDSSEPDLDHGQIGRGRYPWILGAVLRARGLPDLRPPPPPAARPRHRPGAQHRLRRRRCARGAPGGSRQPRTLRATSTCPYAWRLENLFIVNTGTVSTLRLRGKTRPCYNVIEIEGRHVDVWRRYPFHGQERIIQFSADTLEFEKYTARIESEVTARR